MFAWTCQVQAPNIIFHGLQCQPVICLASEFALEIGFSQPSQKINKKDLCIFICCLKKKRKRKMKERERERKFLHVYVRIEWIICSPKWETPDLGKTLLIFIHSLFCYSIAVTFLKKLLCQNTTRKEGFLQKKAAAELLPFFSFSNLFFQE